jgi:hypothetical protein
MKTFKWGEKTVKMILGIETVNVMIPEYGCTQRVCLDRMEQLAAMIFMLIEFQGKIACLEMADM